MRCLHIFVQQVPSPFTLGLQFEPKTPLKVRFVGGSTCEFWALRLPDLAVGLVSTRVSLTGPRWNSGDSILQARLRPELIAGHLVCAGIPFLSRGPTRRTSPNLQQTPLARGVNATKASHKWLPPYPEAPNTYTCIFSVYMIPISVPNVHKYYLLWAMDLQDSGLLASDSNWVTF